MIVIYKDYCNYSKKGNDLPAWKCRYLFKLTILLILLSGPVLAFDSNVFDHYRPFEMDANLATHHYQNGNVHNPIVVDPKSVPSTQDTVHDLLQVLIRLHVFPSPR